MQSLFEQCIDFVAKNIQSVETLQGFPSQIGEMLASRVAEFRAGKLDNTDVKIIEILTQAYTSDVLESLNLSRSQILCKQESLLADRTVDDERLSLLKIINLADLSRLCLNYNTACLSLDWMSTLGQCSLTQLELRGIGLTDRHIVFLTACSSVRNLGLSSLQLLDIGENYLTEKCLHKLACLCSLRMCDVSNTFIQANQVDATMWSISNTDVFKRQIVNKGWLAENIAQRAHCIKGTVVSASTFYRSRSARNEKQLWCYAS
ncbi:leucine-rich repeat-containing protein 42-like isoform X2 [Watersipora subatra]|uniref:leucine-rich repeat-containing protein 42-like isoform X2 n=1 Tax=Watersipora subatra TaxID=2589382 RepID=UPI00355BE880